MLWIKFFVILASSALIGTSSSPFGSLVSNSADTPRYFMCSQEADESEIELLKDV